MTNAAAAPDVPLPAAVIPVAREAAPVQETVVQTAVRAVEVPEAVLTDAIAPSVAVLVLPHTHTANQRPATRQILVAHVTTAVPDMSPLQKN